MKQYLFGPIPKLPVKSIAWIMPLILSGLMSASLSCFNMWMYSGFFEGFFQAWLNSWLLSWLVAYPLILIFLPLVRNFLLQITQTPLVNNHKK